ERLHDARGRGEPGERQHPPPRKHAGRLRALVAFTQRLRAVRPGEHGGVRALPTQAPFDLLRHSCPCWVRDHHEMRTPERRERLAEPAAWGQPTVAPRLTSFHGEDLPILGGRPVVGAGVHHEHRGAPALDGGPAPPVSRPPPPRGGRGSCPRRRRGSSPASFASSRTPSRSATTWTPRVRRP